MKLRYLVLSILTCVCAFGKPVTLVWNDNSSDELGFRIERSIVGQPFVEIGVVGVNVITFVDDISTPGVRYSYRVCAYNAAGKSGYSNVVEYMYDPNAPSNAVIKLTIP